MAYLNANIPVIECYVRGNYLRDQKDSHDKYFPCVIFGFSSLPGQTPLFHYHMEDGGLWWNLEMLEAALLHDLVKGSCNSAHPDGAGV